MKFVLQLPTILSREAFARLIHAARTPSERILLMTLYATGARNSELTHLKVSDIDSQRMVVHIRGGKGPQSRQKLCAANYAVSERHRLLRIAFMSRCGGRLA